MDIREIATILLGLETKNDTVHAILKLLSTGEKYDWDPIEIASRITPWYRFKKYSIHKIDNACRVLKKEDVLHDLSSGKWIMTGHTQLKNAREFYESGKYKEPASIWIWPTRIISTLVGLATIYGVIESSQSKKLQDTIGTKNKEIELLKKLHVLDSLKLDSVTLQQKKDSSK